MKFKIDRDLFLSNLNNVSKAISTKPQSPIYTGIKLEVRNDSIVLTANNQEFMIQSKIENSELFTISSEGTVVLPGRYLVEIIKKCDAKEITITTFEQNMVKILSNKSSFTLNTFDKSDFAYHPFIESRSFFYLDGLNLKQIIKKTSFATSSSESKVIYTGVNLSTKNNKLTACASDGYRYTEKYMLFDNDIPDTVALVPSKSLDELNKIVDEVDQIVQVHVSRDKILFKYKNILFQSRLIEGTFPNTTSFIPKEFIMDIKFNKEELLNAIDRVSLFDSNYANDHNLNLIKLSITEEGILKLSSLTNEIGDALEILNPIAISKAIVFETAFSSKYMLDALKALDSNEITIHFASEVKPFIITGEYDVNHFQLILPIRLS